MHKIKILYQFSFLNCIQLYALRMESQGKLHIYANKNRGLSQKFLCKIHNHTFIPAVFSAIIN